MASGGAALTPAQIQAALAGPAAPPPPGVHSNFDNPSSLNVWINFTLSMELIIATVAILARLLTRWHFQRKLAVEDYLIVFTWMAMVAENVPGMIAVQWGAGRHMWDIHLSDFLTSLYYVNITSILYGFSIIGVKTSLLLQIQRVFAPNRRMNLRLWIGTWLCIVLVALFYTIDTVFDIIQCLPREKIWNPFHPGHCFNSAAMYKATGIFNVLSDFAILLLPMPDIYALQIELRKKALIMACFATGLLACVTSIMRTYYTWRLYASPDISWNTAIMGLWTWAEICMGILVFCLPIAPKFCYLVKEKVTSSLHSLRTAKSESNSAEYSEFIEVSRRDANSKAPEISQLSRLPSAEAGTLHHQSSTGELAPPQPTPSRDGSDAEKASARSLY